MADFYHYDYFQGARIYLGSVHLKKKEKYISMNAKHVFSTGPKKQSSAGGVPEIETRRLSKFKIHLFIIRKVINPFNYIGYIVVDMQYSTE